MVNVRKEAGIRNPESDTWLEVDVFIPSLKLGFEFQVSGLGVWGGGWGEGGDRFNSRILNRNVITLQEWTMLLGLSIFISRGMKPRGNSLKPVTSP